MGHDQLSRRQLLAGVAGAGGFGTIVGTGTGALVGDRDTVLGGGVSPAVMDLAVDWQSAGSGGSSRGSVPIPLTLTAAQPTASVDLTVSLPAASGPASDVYAWVGADCPDDGLGTHLGVRLSYADCDRDCGLFEGSLTELAAGVPLDGQADPTTTAGTQACLAADDVLALSLEVSAAGFDAVGETSFTLAVAGRQCRYGDGTVVPFPGSDGTCSEPSKRAGRRNGTSNASESTGGETDGTT